MNVRIYGRLAERGWRGQVVERQDNPRVPHIVNECRHAHRNETLALECAKKVAAKRYPGVTV